MQDLRTLFESEYPGKERLFETLIKPIFSKAKDTTLTDNQFLADSDKKQIKSFSIIAQVRGGFPIVFADIELQDTVALKRSRVNIQNCVRKVMEDNSNAIIFFHFTDNAKEWRVSYVHRAETNKNSTSAKRYTYLCGPEHSCRTVSERFEMLKGLSTIKDEDMIDAFSLEALTEEFYKELFAWYEWAREYVKYPFGVDKKVELVDYKQDEKLISTHIIRLITRLIFVWFIKQKGLVPKELFDKDSLAKILNNFDDKKFDSVKDGTYYNAILQNLFFATLNNQISERAFAEKGENYTHHFGIKTLFRDSKKESYFKISHEEFVELFSKIPYLNGGLFECLDHFDEDVENYNHQIYVDGFSAEDGRKAFVPNALFFDEEKGIIPILKAYNFTVEESTPSDIQVALDPELLGKVFENLLGAYNPETQESARKDSGSFYTPREIVEYMVNESLKSYLMNDGSLDDKTILDLLDGKEDFDFKENESQKIIERLLSIKVLDPACGSGAFPMGMLGRLVEIIGALDKNISPYELKLKLIQNCIYGVDIQPMAVQISKLRFFISLICEQEKTSNADENYGINTLPNLETKIVCANSLIGVKRNKENHGLFHNDEIDKLEKELLEVRNKHIFAKNVKEKFNLRQEDRKISKRLVELLKKDGEFGEANDSAEMLAKWNPYDQNAQSPFFDAEWMFGIKDGFDIVIGNPPYIQLQKDNGKLASNYENQGFKCFAKTGDVYCLFYEKGFNLLKENGSLCFITSNKWMRAGYGEKLRSFFASNVNPKTLVDFSGVRVFKSATVDTNILMFEKGKNKGKTRSCIANMPAKNGLSNLGIFVQQNSSECAFSSSDSWTILSPIEQSIKRKIESVGVPLKNWDISINYGIKTGYNDAFIISKEKRNEILANCKTDKERQETAKIIRPILRGRDIKRYSYEYANLYLIATFPSRHYDIEKYPAVKKHLLNFGMERLEQTGKKYKMKGKEINARKKTNNKWFETQDSISYWDEFDKPKIVWARLMRLSKSDLDAFPRFCYIPKDFYVVDSLCFFTGTDIEILIKELNSEFAAYYFFNSVATLDNGGFQMRQQYVEEIPLPKLSKLNANTNIDKEIYKVFDLTDEEIKFIKTFIFNKKKEIESLIK